MRRSCESVNPLLQTALSSGSWVGVALQLSSTESIAVLGRRNRSEVRIPSCWPAYCESLHQHTTKEFAMNTHVFVVLRSSRDH
jgi:hypothetical protein